MKRPKSVEKLTRREDALFFQRLSEWPLAVEAAKFFDQLAEKRALQSPEDFYETLYRELIDHLLRWYDLPYHYSWVASEWRAVYGLHREINPQYFTKATIDKAVEGVIGVMTEEGEELSEIINKFFLLRRNNFPSNYPIPYLSTIDCLRWMEIFPGHLAWQSMDILRRVGLSTKVSRKGYRAFIRFTEGTFDTPLLREQTHRWHAACWGATTWVHQGEYDEMGPHRANFVAFLFATGYQTETIQGICGDVPKCEQCILQLECAWKNSPASNKGSPNESLALSALGRGESLIPSRVIQGLLNLSETEHQWLKGRIRGHTLREMGEMGIAELRGLFNAGEHLAERISLTFELCRRFNEERIMVGENFQTAWDVFKHFHMRLRDLKQEQFIVMLLDNHRRYIGDEMVSQGTLNAAPVHPRDVFSRAVKASAASIIVVHNHPSGEPVPSKADINLTHLLQDAGKILGIPLLDHVIIGNDHYYSMVDHGLIT